MAITILVADDLALVRLSISEILRSVGYIVELANDGKEALRKAISIKPDLITLDMVMPYLDGLSVLKELKKNKETKDIPVVILSCISDKEYIVKAHLAGAIEYINKPVESKTFIERIRNILKNSGKLITQSEQRKIPSIEIKLVGDISYETHEKTLENVWKAVSESPKELYLDIEGVKYIDIIGISKIVQVAELCNKSDIKVMMRIPSNSKNAIVPMLQKMDIQKIIPLISKQEAKQ